jgi:hypothetical protein
MGGNYHPNSVSDKLNLHRESMPEQIEARGAQYLHFIGARVYKEDIGHRRFSRPPIKVGDSSSGSGESASPKKESTDDIP